MIWFSVILYGIMAGIYFLRGVTGKKIAVYTSISYSSCVAQVYLYLEKTSTNILMLVLHVIFGCIWIGLLTFVEIKFSNQPKILKKNKWIAALLSYFLGGFGTCKFYLGQHIWGAIYVLFWWTFIPTILSIIESIVLLIMPKDKFEKYKDFNIRNLHFKNQKKKNYNSNITSIKNETVYIKDSNIEANSSSIDDKYEWTNCVIYYPLIKHPLHTEKEELKKKYIALISKYAERYDKSDRRDSDLKILYYSMFGENSIENVWKNYTQQEAYKVLRTHFSHFRFFSYRYIFMFDCLLLFAVSDEKTAKRICSEFKEHIHCIYHKKIDKMVSMMYDGDKKFAEKTFISPNMVKAWEDARAYSQSREKSVYFTATMSAGKSTLINSIIGENLSCTKKAACTSTVIRFHSAPNISNLYTVVDGNDKQYLKSPKDVQNFIKGRTQKLDVVGYFSSILRLEKYILVDTPGINSSLNPQHKELTRKELSAGNIETLVYVIPVETYGSEDDYNHLSYVLNKVSYEKIIFVVNMMDTYNPEDDTVEEILQNIKKHLIEIGFENPIICPVSAKAGLQLKKMIKGSSMTDNELESAKNYVKLFSNPEFDFGKYYSYNNYKKDELSKALVSTGLLGLETLIFSI